MNNNINKPLITEYFKTIYKTIRHPKRIFCNCELSLYQINCYLVLSAWLYALIANCLKTLAPFILLILSPLSIIPHLLLINISIYIIFKYIYNVKINFSKSYKDTSLIFIALLPFMSIEYFKYFRDWPLIMIKAIPFIYFIVLFYKFIQSNFKDLKTGKKVQSLVLSSLIILFISTIVFSINMSILIILYETVIKQNYLWHINY